MSDAIEVSDKVVEQPVKWYGIIHIVQYTSQYSRYYDVKIKFVSNSFLETFKKYMSNYLFTRYNIMETGVHPESVPPQTLFNCPCHRYSLYDDRVIKGRNINIDEKTFELVSTIERSMSSYMKRFIRHVHSKHSKCGLCCFNYFCHDVDWYFSNYKYVHRYDLDTDTFTTWKRDRNGKMIPYTF